MNLDEYSYKIRLVSISPIITLFGDQINEYVVNRLSYRNRVVERQEILDSLYEWMMKETIYRAFSVSMYMHYRDDDYKTLLELLPGFSYEFIHLLNTRLEHLAMKNTNFVKLTKLNDIILLGYT